MPPALSDQWFLAALAQASGGHADLSPASQAPVAIAVSGGADSMALVTLAASALGRARIRALSVDHRLRPTAAEEAAQVALSMAAAGIGHQTLVWEGQKPGANIQQAARLARYRLMEDWCAAHGVAWLMLAHHQNDQAETLLLRLARGSGVDGLAAMAPMRPALTRQDGPHLLRPLLDVPAAALRAYLTAAGIGWIEDPSNRNADFDRVKARALLADPPLPGLNAQRLAGVAASMQRARTALAHYTNLLMDQAVGWHPTGHATVARSALLAAPDDIALRCLALVAARVGGRDHPPRLAHLLHLLAAMRAGRGIARTLAGVQVLTHPSKADALTMTREPAAASRCQLDLAPGDWALWDGRFMIGLARDARPCRVRALGSEGWQQLKRAGRAVTRYDIALSQPSLWRQGRLVAAPTLDYNVDNALADKVVWQFVPVKQPLTGAPGLVYGLN